MNKRQKTTKFYSQFMSSGDIVYDVGANVGNKTAVFLALEARVIALEPQPNCVAKLSKRFGDKATIIQTALSDRDGTASLNLTSASILASMNQNWIDAVKAERFKKFNWHKVIKVPTTSIDKLVIMHGTPKFIKIDVAGYELNVLKGLHHRIKTVSFKFIPESNIALSCIERMVYLSPEYRFNYSLLENNELTLDKWVEPTQIISILESYKTSKIFGDIYAKLIT